MAWSNFLLARSRNRLSIRARKVRPQHGAGFASRRCCSFQCAGVSHTWPQRREHSFLSLSRDPEPQSFASRLMARCRRSALRNPFRCAAGVRETSFGVVCGTFSADAEPGGCDELTPVTYTGTAVFLVGLKNGILVTLAAAFCRTAS